MTDTDLEIIVFVLLAVAIGVYRLQESKNTLLLIVFQKWLVWLDGDT